MLEDTVFVTDRNSKNIFRFDRIRSKNKFSHTKINVFSKYVSSKKRPSQ